MSDADRVVEIFVNNGADLELARAMYLIFDPLSFPRVDPGLPYHLRRHTADSAADYTQLAYICLIAGDAEMASDYFEKAVLGYSAIGMHPYASKYVDPIMDNIERVKEIVKKTTPVFNEIRKERKEPLLETYGPGTDNIRAADLKFDIERILERLGCEEEV